MPARTVQEGLTLAEDCADWQLAALRRWRTEHPERTQEQAQAHKTRLDRAFIGRTLRPLRVGTGFLLSDIPAEYTAPLEEVRRANMLMQQLERRRPKST